MWSTIKPIMAKPTTAVNDIIQGNTDCILIPVVMRL